MNIEKLIEQKREERDGKSFAFLTERCATSEEAPYRIRPVENLRSDEPMVLVLGGTHDDDGYMPVHNGMLKRVDNFVHQNHEFDKVRVCIAVCDFGKYHCDEAARKLFYYESAWPNQVSALKNNVPDSCQQETFNPAYIQDVFDAVVLPRISENDGKERLPQEQALQYVRGLNIVGHCNAGYVAMSLERLMDKKMAELNYSGEEQKQMKSQLMTMIYNPNCPNMLSELYFLSIESARDGHNQYNNYMKEWLLMEPKDFDVCYLPKRWGRTLMCSRVSDAKKVTYEKVSPDDWFKGLYRPRNRDIIGEHDFMGFIPAKNMTKGAIKLQKMANNVLQNAMRNSLQQQNGFVPLPKIQDLVANTVGQKVMFAKAAVIGYGLEQKLFRADKSKIDAHADYRRSIPRVNLR